MFETIHEFKAAAEFFPAGRIVPQRIIKGPRKFKSGVIFGADSWALPTRKGYLIACDMRNSDHCVSIKKAHDCKFTGSPYFPPGSYTSWVSSGHFGSDDAWIENLNACLVGKK
jgi:hypothetical protein